MAKKLYKRQYTNDDLRKIEGYVKEHGVELLVEVWTNGSDDGDVYTIQAGGIAQAITITDKYYDSACADSAELLVREKNGEFTCLYHIEKNRSGVTYEVLSYCK